MGKYKHGKPEGKGRYEWKDGGYYEGEFLRGMREGKGVWVDSNGTTYEGTYRCIQVQVNLRKILSMGKAQRRISRGRSSKESSTGERRCRGRSSRAQR